MLDIQDLNYIYSLIERSSVNGSEVDKVVQVKLKIINVLKQAALMADKQREETEAKGSKAPSNPNNVQVSAEMSQAESELIS